MSLDVSYDHAEFEQIKRRIRAMRERALDVSPAWDALLTWFAEQNFEQWLGRGARYRDPWPPLAARTVAEKFAKGLPLHPMIRTGRLVNSLSHRPLAVEHITGSEVTAGTNVPYAVHHQYGAPRAHLPRRVLFDPEQIRREQAATSAIANWITKGERKVSGRTVMRGGG